jgi:dihydroflavonol-4-reductase
VRALVTGAAGFIGSHVVRTLLAAGHQVRALHLPGERLDNLAGLPVELFAGDVTDAAIMGRAVKGCDHVFHLAAIYALWLPEPERMRRVNVQGTRNVLQAALDAGVERVVYTSSIAVFGGQGPGRDATERSPFALGATGDLYSRTKHESHRVALEYVGRGLDVTIVAPCGPLGPGDIGPTPTGRLLLSAINMPMPVLVDTTTNFADVRDMATAHLLAAERGKTGESYLLGHENVHLGDLARMALGIAGLRRPVIELPPVLVTGAAHGLVALANLRQRPPLVTPAALRIARLGLRADCTRAKRQLGMPTRPIADSVRDALIWFARNGYVRSRRARERLLHRERASRSADEIPPTGDGPVRPHRAGSVGAR